jgi:hypothetical protein
MIAVEKQKLRKKKVQRLREVFPLLDRKTSEKGKDFFHFVLLSFSSKEQAV